MTAKLERQNQIPQRAVIVADSNDAGNRGATILAAMAAAVYQAVGSDIVSAETAVTVVKIFAQLSPAGFTEYLPAVGNLLPANGAARRTD